MDKKHKKASEHDQAASGDQATSGASKTVLDSAGHQALQHILDSEVPDTLPALLAVLKASEALFPDPTKDDGRDPAATDAGFLREELVQLHGKQGDELAAALARVRNVGHRVSSGGGAYAEAASKVHDLAVRALKLATS